MRRVFASVAVTSGWLLIAAAGASAVPGNGSAPRGPVKGKHVPFGCVNPANHGNSGKVKGAPAQLPAGQAICFGDAIADASHNNAGPQIMSGPTGYGPSQIQSAYKLAGLTTTGTVSIVDAFNDPNAASDLAVYRSAYGLAPCAVASGCLKIVNQTGATSPLPATDDGWSEEISLDLDAVSAACPTCHIELVEASSASTADLIAAEQTAEAANPAAISNSWGEAESSATSDQTTYDQVFNHPGIPIVAGSGDSGYGTFWPAANPYLTAAGGTTLSSASNARGWTEAAWSGAGSGCSNEPKPALQTDAGCAFRTIADVSADADPSTGLGVYDTVNSCGSSFLCDLFIELGLVQGLDGWAQVGGTSLATPVIASVYALAGNGSQVNGANLPYGDPGGLFDVTSGSNGSCGGSYLCTAGPGYDGPTGLGTPDGTAAF